MTSDAACPKAILCAYEVIGDYADAQVEVCTYCGKKVIYNKADNRIDNKKYLRDHRRDFIQPHEPLFRKVYPDRYQQFIELAEAKERAAQTSKDAEYVRKAESDYQRKQTIYA